MNKQIRRWLPVILVLIFAISTVTPALAAPRIPDFVRLPDQAPAVINYVALGDSNAAGVRAKTGELPGLEEGSDYGYTDLIADWLFDGGFIDSFNEDYSISGNTAAKLARATSSKAYKNLVHADIVTLTIGANDFLGPFYEYFDICTENGVPIDPVEALFALKAGIDYFDAGGGKEELQANVETILGKILKASKGAKVYVMGYYNPLPILIEFAEKGIKLDGESISMSLNSIAYFLSSKNALGMDYEDFIEIPPEAKLSQLNSILDQLLPTLLPSLSP
ncbi:MAG TPA: GDSL-type esterase/lipase family protein, partial [Sedimentibacter sp.]|nr:GDSL-type esterase/lipase family protein [Sedimentibacter sp.]